MTLERTTMAAHSVFPISSIVPFKMMVATLLTWLLLACAFIIPLPSHSTTVHLVAHTHDDVGWLVTVDQYYIGSVQYIITTVIEQLLANPDRKFIYVEMAFFTRWWRQQNAQVQQQVRDLVKSGQLEFINGGWCMHDEASTHYVDMVDQTTLGHTFIKENFGVTPKVGWQIDPFGHSSTQASLLAGETGFFAEFFGRIDYQDYRARSADKTLEWLWRPSPALGEEAEIFAGQFWNGYGPPRGFDFNMGSDDLPVQDDPRLDDYNVDSRVDDFVRAAEEQARIFQGENLMWTMGSDFHYEAAHEWFVNLDKLIAAVNKDGRVKAQYSTPSIYVKAKNAENLQFTVKTDDIFPYADGPDAFWTGYFTSRVGLKRYVRSSSNFLQVARHLELFTGGDGNATSALWEALSVAQHHDGVSGTAKQAVTYDYAQRISVGAAQADKTLEGGLAALLTKSGGAKPTFTYCPLANISVCDVTSGRENVAVVLYNVQARSRTELVRIPLAENNCIIVDSSGKQYPSQTVPLPQTNPARIPESHPYEVRFVATVPGLGAQTYFITFASAPESVVEQHQEVTTIKHDSVAVEKEAVSMYSRNLKQLSNSFTKKASLSAPPTISNEKLKLDFDANGLLSQVTEIASGKVTKMQQNFYWYHSFAQNGQQNSGAYIFRPSDPNDVGTAVATKADVTVVVGVLSSEVQQTFAPWLTQVIRLKTQSSEIEFEYTVGPIPIDDHQGKEIISRFFTDIASQSTWYTDSNGREWQKRVLNYRPGWNLTVTQPVAGNYYPCNVGAWIADSTSAMSILNDRTQGCASLHDGELEFMVHRRLTADDGRGVGEPLNEPGLDGKGLITTGSHYVQLAEPSNIAAVTRQRQMSVYSSLHQTYSPLTSGSVSDYLSTHNSAFTFLSTPLPANVELMSAYKTGANSMLLRLAHSFGLGEDANLSKPVDIDLATIFVPSIKPTNIEEVSLTANQSPADVSSGKLKWNTKGSNMNDNLQPRIRGSMKATTITLQPMEIRTFVLTF